MRSRGPVQGVPDSRVGLRRDRGAAFRPAGPGPRGLPTRHRPVGLRIAPLGFQIVDHPSGKGKARARLGRGTRPCGPSVGRRAEPGSGYSRNSPNGPRRRVSGGTQRTRYSAWPSAACAGGTCASGVGRPEGCRPPLLRLRSAAEVVPSGVDDRYRRGRACRASVSRVPR
jgi:hypothetical protein